MNRIQQAPIVRFVDTTTACVWVELTGPSAVLLSVKPLVAKKSRSKRKVHEHVVYSVRVGTRYFALGYVTNLAPATWYTYAIETNDLTGATPTRYPTTPDRVRCYKSYQRENLNSFAIDDGPVLRTLAKKGQEVFRLAFGSCRKLGGGQREKKGNDAFEAFGGWLKETSSDRLTRWPHVLLLTGDQVYADDISPNLMTLILKNRPAGADAPISLDTVKPNPIKRAGVYGSQLISFEEFALLYTGTWFDHRAQLVLANMPTFMMIDDHEVTDDWDIDGKWQEQMRADPMWVATIIDAVAAYWVYQGWGNLHPEKAGSDARVALFNDHAKKGTDALPELRELLEQKLWAKPDDRLPWSYRIDSSPPIFAIDVRADRELLPPTEYTNGWVYADPDDRIASDHQLSELDAQLSGIDEPIIFATALPILHPQPLFTALILIARPILGLLKAYEIEHSEAWEKLRRDEDMEGWFAFPRSVDDLGNLVDKMQSRGQKFPMIVLSGDVHFSYAMWTRIVTAKTKDGHPLLQLATSPFFNALDKPNRDRFKTVMEEGFPLGDNFVIGIADLNPYIEARKDWKAVDGLEDLVSKVEVIVEGLAAMAGTGNFPKALIGPHFTKIEKMPAGTPDVVEDEILFENNICFLQISRNRKMLEAEWWIPNPDQKTTLIPACSLRKSLATS